MALDQDKIGREYPPYRYEVAREKIREYAEALGEIDPRYYSDGDDCVAPPSFAASFTIVKGLSPVLADLDIGVEYEAEEGGQASAFARVTAAVGMLHGEQRFTFGDRPLKPGDVLLCTSRIADITVIRDNEFLTVEVDCRFEDTGDRAVLATNRIIFIGSGGQDEDR